MKKQLIILVGFILLQSTSTHTMQSYSTANRIGRFLLKATYNGLEGKAWKLSLGASIAVAAIFKEYKKVNFKKAFAYGLSAMFGSAFILGSIKITKECIWPNKEKIQERERLKQKYAELRKSIEYLDTEGKRLAQEKINTIQAETKVLDHKIAQRNVKRAFYKSLAENENSPLNAEGFPIACEALAQQFRTLCGEELYQKELATFKEGQALVTKNRQRASRLSA